MKELDPKQALTVVRYRTKESNILSSSVLEHASIESTFRYRSPVQVSLGDAASCSVSEMWLRDDVLGDYVFLTGTERQSLERSLPVCSKCDLKEDTAQFVPPVVVC